VPLLEFLSPYFSGLLCPAVTVSRLMQERVGFENAARLLESKEELG